MSHTAKKQAADRKPGYSDDDLMQLLEIIRSGRFLVDPIPAHVAAGDVPVDFSTDKREV